MEAEKIAQRYCSLQGRFILESFEDFEKGIGAAICAAMPEPFFIFDEEGRYVQIIGGADRNRYHSGAHLIGQRIHDVIDKEMADTFVREIHTAIASGSPHTYVYSLSADDITGSENLPGPKGKQWFEAHISPIVQTADEPRMVVWIAFNITTLYTTLQEKDELIEQMAEAAKEIKDLRGILPICSHCKKIRDDNGYWNQLESYLHEHSGADFSHSICPGCLNKYYSKYT